MSHIDTIALDAVISATEATARGARAAQPNGRPVGADIFFPVVKRDIGVAARDGSFRAIRGSSDFAATVRMIGDEPVTLGVVGAGYEVVPMRGVVDQAEAGITSVLGDNALADAKITDRTAYNGAFVSRQYVIRTGDEVKPKDRKVGDLVGMTISIVNTYDGSGAVGLTAGTEVLACTNGMVRFSSMGAARKRHTSGTRGFDWAALVRKGLAAYEQDILRMRAMADMAMTPEQAEAALRTAGISDRGLTRLMGLFHREMAERGRNAWALANAISFDATHREMRNTGSDHAAATLLQRQQDAETLLDRVLAASGFRA